MNTKIAALLVALMASLTVSYASAAESLKVGYVNTQRIFRDAPTAIRAAKKLEAEFSKRDQELQQLAKHVQELQQSLEKNAMSLISKVSTSTDRSRYLFPFSHEVSGANRQL